MASFEPVRWGILGTADINRKLLKGASLTDAVEVVAICSRTEQRAREAAEKFAIPRWHSTYEALLADPDVEAVYISVPNSLHHEWTMRALAAGKHVLCEKPYTRHPDEVTDAFDLADSRDLILSEAFMWRHHPQAARLKELLPTVGRLETIRASFNFVLDRDADIRLRPDLEGGSLMDVGCYCVSGARYAANEEPEWVFGTSVGDDGGVDRRFTGVLRFPSGVVAEFTSSFVVDHRGLELIGTEGTVLFTDPWQSISATVIVAGVETAFDEVDPYQCEIDNISAAIRGEAEPRLGRADALGQARAIEALYRSAAAGSAVRL
jgi:D-xylose 1-dehydrogenase (NADP+, D-xylono-1,5-lactone-forming)